jgi:hypothetical protein
VRSCTQPIASPAVRSAEDGRKAALNVCCAGEGRRLIERSAFIVRDNALAETIVLVQDGR